MLGPARWHWQLNYSTGRGGWLSAEKSSGRCSLPRSPPVPNLSTPLSSSPSPCHPLSRETLSPSSPPGSSWQVISTITITAITGVINKWPTPSQGSNKGFIIHHARLYKYTATGNKQSSRQDEGWCSCKPGCITICLHLVQGGVLVQEQIQVEATDSDFNAITAERGF